MTQFKGKQLGPAQNQWIGIAFDLVDLYPSLPTGSEVLNLIYDFLSHWDVPDRLHIIHLLDFLFQFTWFSFRGRFYHQVTGLAMGHSHSPPLANLLVYLLLEKQMGLDSLNLPFYCRYLDDGGLIIDGTMESIAQLFADWNRPVPGLGFTYETCMLESGESFSFLDLSISQDLPPFFSIQFSTYQKSLNQYLYIHQSSLHPPLVKSSVVKTELIRYLRTNSIEEGFNKIKAQFWQ